jgi:hypothetical protein
MHNDYLATLPMVLSIQLMSMRIKMDFSLSQIQFCNIPCLIFYKIECLPIMAITLMNYHHALSKVVDYGIVLMMTGRQ